MSKMLREKIVQAIEKKFSGKTFWFSDNFLTAMRISY